MNELHAGPRARADHGSRRRGAGSFVGVTALAVALLAAVAVTAPVVGQEAFRLNEREYFVRGGVNVMAFQDIYPEGHQGGVSVVQHDVRVASNGDLRLEPTPGQWQPVPRQLERVVDREAGEIVTRLVYPDTAKHRKGFNPIVYPDLELAYTVRVRAAGDAVRVTVDLAEPLPAEWVGRVGFNLELFPTELFGRSWQLGGREGIFPRQPNGPMRRDARGELQTVPFAAGPRLTVAGEAPEQRLVIESETGDLQLLDGRNRHNNGWFVVRSLVPAGATAGAVEWRIRPHAVPGWLREPVVQLSQVGYHPRQPKVAVIETDARDMEVAPARLLRVAAEGGLDVVVERAPEVWEGEFLRYRYLRFDFTEVTQPGMYVVEYGGYRTEPFRIAADVYRRDVWQPTIDHYLPIQMCHMRVEEKYRVWHGVDHLDDARMAPPDSNHFDGYVQGPSTLTAYEAYDRVPGLDRGGWHDAGDDDLRIESQADEVWVLATTYEEFGVDYDNTRIDQSRRLVRIHEPDGVPDLLQQVEHGVLSILGGYRALGRLYRGIIVPTLEQYVLIGDPTNYSDNLVYDLSLAPDERTATSSGVPDDRLVFTEEHPAHEYLGIRALAVAGRVLRDYRPQLAREALEAAESLWREERPPGEGFDQRVWAAVELLLTTGDAAYADALVAMQDGIVERIGATGWAVGRVLDRVDSPAFAAAIRRAVAGHAAEVREAERRNPYGVPYEPYIWGAGWGIQDFGVRQYFLHTGFPERVPADYMLNALGFVLGTHPGRNTASFVSGVGARSVTTAYGFNRGDWHYLPGGSVSGTALIRPDLPELKEFPYLWQQVEYVMGGGATHAMFLTLAADALLRDAAR
ncbi:MAG: glycoside hydrolase family 9 protein [Longimicrobiales bacterium]|nr:glycoside hydrolase family 9 protein [Longimicrobiales bacterium]